MSTLSLPSWFDVYECEASLVPEVRGFAGPFGGPTELQDLLGDRWRFRLTLPDGNFAWGGRTEALFNRLRGGADWLRLHHFAKPVPRGSARGSIVTASSMAQGANSMSLSGLVSNNLLLGASFEIDLNTDGLANGWTLYQSGTVGTVGTTLNAGPAISGSYGTKYQRVSSTGLNGRLGVYQQCAVLPSTEYTFSVEVGATASVAVELSIQWFTAGAVYISEAANSHAAALALRQVTGTAPANAAFATVYCLAYDTSGAAIVLDIDNAQLEAAGVATPYLGPATLLAGDMLGHNSEQLFQVYEDALANELGDITVTTVNRARKTIASGQAIVWDKPNIPFQLLDTAGVPTAYTRGRARGQQVEFIEAWTS